MQRKSILRLLVIGILLTGAGWLLPAPGVAKEILRYCSSAQVREAFGMEGLNAFKQDNDLVLDLFVSSFRSALYRLMNGFCDIASTAERLSLGHQDYGWESESRAIRGLASVF